jgi:hypothetical protein
MRTQIKLIGASLCVCVTVWGGKTVKERALIDGAEAMPAISNAFEAAWAHIAWIFDKDPLETEKAREQLMRAVLSSASENSQNVESLVRAALERKWYAIS